jgi:uncharacterized membrane protein
MNTVFKIYYQAWLLLGIVGSYGLYYLWSARSSVSWPINLGRILPVGRYVWIATVSVLFLASMYFPLGAALDRTGVLRDGHSVTDNTLDGLAFLKRSSPGEYAAIEWLRDDASWGRMVEAVGDDYTDFARISSSTGLPTVLGWKGHELQWRGASSFTGREEDVNSIYSSADSGLVRLLLDAYDVRYVYLGSRERRTYGGYNLADFEQSSGAIGSAGFLKTAFEQDGVIIYEMVQSIAENK